MRTYVQFTKTLYVRRLFILLLANLDQLKKNYDENLTG